MNVFDFDFVVEWELEFSLSFELFFVYFKFGLVKVL